MASLIQEQDGRRRIQFYDGNRKRRNIGLGSISERNAERIRDKVEQLVEHSVTGTPLDGEVSRWAAGLDDKLYGKLAKAGLVETRERAAVDAAESHPSAGQMLGAFLTDYLAKRTDVKQGALTFYGHTQRNLEAFFGADKLLSDITEGDADDFRHFLKRDGLSDATVNRCCGLAKTFFRAAVRHRLLPANPFQDLDASPKSNSTRQRFIDREVIDRVIEVAPDAEWRLLIALARYGGLRIPSEALSLKRQDVDFARERIRVTAPKTAHHDGRGVRDLPLFPELLEPLRDVFEQAEDGAEYVITRHRPASVQDKAGLSKIRGCSGFWFAQLLFRWGWRQVGSAVHLQARGEVGRAPGPQVLDAAVTQRAANHFRSDLNRRGHHRQQLTRQTLGCPLTATTQQTFAFAD